MHVLVNVFHITQTFSYLQQKCEEQEVKDCNSTAAQNECTIETPQEAESATVEVNSLPAEETEDAPTLQGEGEIVTFKVSWIPEPWVLFLTFVL
jgi:hypothetical protein